MPLEVNGKSLATDEEGYLANMSEWHPEVANVMAEIDDCNLSENHWEVINFCVNTTRSTRLHRLSES